MVVDADDRGVMREILKNSMLSEAYLTLGRDLEAMDAKSPQDIYKLSTLT